MMWRRHRRRIAALLTRVRSFANLSLSARRLPPTDVCRVRVAPQPLAYFTGTSASAPRNDAAYWGLAECYHSGLVKNVGVSNYGPTLLARAHAHLAARGVPLASNQFHYSLLARHRGEQATVDACRALGVALLGAGCGRPADDDDNEAAGGGRRAPDRGLRGGAPLPLLGARPDGAASEPRCVDRNSLLGPFAGCLPCVCTSESVPVFRGLGRTGPTHQDLAAGFTNRNDPEAVAACQGQHNGAPGGGGRAEGGRC